MSYSSYAAIPMLLVISYASACGNVSNVSAGHSDRQASDLPMVDVLGSPLNQWSLNEARGRTLPLQANGDLLPKRGLKISDNGSTALVLDTVLPRIFEVANESWVPVLSQPMGQPAAPYGHTATSLAQCPQWSALEGNIPLPRWARHQIASNGKADLPILASYDAYDVVLEQGGVRLISRPCVLQRQNRDPLLQQIALLGEHESDDVRFGLELEFFLMPFRELEAAVTAWGGQLQMQSIAVDRCALDEFWEEAVAGNRRVFHMFGEGVYTLNIQDRFGSSWRTDYSLTLFSEEAVHEYLASHSLPADFHRFSFGWKCSAAAPFTVASVLADTIRIHVAKLGSAPIEVDRAFFLSDRGVAFETDPRYASHGDDLNFVVNQVKAEMELHAISVQPRIDYWQEPIVVKTDSAGDVAPEAPSALWELALPPLELDQTRLHEVRALRRHLKQAHPNGHLGVRGGYPAAIHINVEVPQAIIQAGKAWEVARQYLVFWMQHRQAIMDSYFSTAELPANRGIYFGAIPESVVNELATLDLSTHDLTTWLYQELHETVEGIRNIDVNVENAEDGRIEVRVSSNDFSEPWHNIEARIRFCVGLMRYILNNMPGG